MMSIPYKELEQMVKHLNDENKVIAKSFLLWLLERQLNDEDDVLSFDDIQAIEQAREDLKNGKTTSLEDLERDLGL